MQSVVCTKCNWTHMGISRAQATRDIDHFNKYYNSLSLEKQTMLYGGKGATIKDYEECYRCGGRKFVAGCTAPRGSTISPVIFESEAASEDNGSTTDPA